MKCKKVILYQSINIVLILFVIISSPVFSQNYNDSLLDGAWSGNVEKVKRSVLNKADVNFHTNDGTTALHYACGGNYLPVVRVLVSAGANVNVYDINSKSPLHIAALNGSDSIGEFLIVNGASLSQCNNAGMTPLLIAVFAGHYVFTDMCLYYGSNINEKMVDSTGVCHLSVFSAHPDILQMLINRGASINECSLSGYTPMMDAVINNDTTCLGILLRAGALMQPPCRGSAKTDLIRLAVLKGCPESAEYLLQIPETRKQSDLKQVRDIVIRHNDKTMVKVFRNNSIPMSWKPVFQGLLVKPELFINFRDHFFGFSMGTMELKSKIGFEFGVASRLWKKRLLYEFETTGELLQLQEKRGFVYFGQYKAIRFFQKRYSGLQIESGVQETYTWAYFDGMSISPWRGWTISPAIDVVWFGRNWSVSLGARYYSFNNTLPAYYFSLSGGWVIPFNK